MSNFHQIKPRVQREIVNEDTIILFLKSLQQQLISFETYDGLIYTGILVDITSEMNLYKSSITIRECIIDHTDNQFLPLRASQKSRKSQSQRTIFPNETNLHTNQPHLVESSGSPKKNLIYHQITSDTPQEIRNLLHQHQFLHSIKEFDFQKYFTLDDKTQEMVIKLLYEQHLDNLNNEIPRSMSSDILTNDESNSIDHSQYLNNTTIFLKKIKYFRPHTNIDPVNFMTSYVDKLSQFYRAETKGKGIRRNDLEQKKLNELMVLIGLSGDLHNTNTKNDDSTNHDANKKRPLPHSH